MFEGPSDLIVVPCSTVPTVSYFVADRLRAFGLPIPKERMAPGEVVFHRLEKAGQVAPIAAYAASVVPRTQEDAGPIEAIGRALGRFAAEKENTGVQQISCPLLGAGAGGLKSERSVEDLLRGFNATGRDDVLLRVFVLHDSVYERLKTYFGTTVSNEWEGHEPTRPIRVFVSYARTDDAHTAWVRELATFLRANGVEARLDAWYLRPGMDAPQWMSNELDLADRVLLVCDELYAQKADRRHGGVGWEIRIIQGDLMASQDDNPDKYVPIIVTPELDAGTPKFLRGTFAIHWPESSPDKIRHRDELLRVIYGRQEEAPPLGRPPSFILASAN
jgi:TIR domain